MNIEKQVCSLKLAKRLKELNCKQDSLFYWVESSEGQEDYRVQCKDCAYEYGNHRVYSAFTVAELGEMLPYFLEDESVDYPCKSNKSVTGKEPIEIEWFWYYKIKVSGYADTEANARGEMLAYLIENKLIK